MKLDAHFDDWARLRAANGAPVDLKQLKDVLTGISDFYRPVKLYLFGSLVTGNYTGHSDLDLLIVVPDDAEPSRQRPGFVVEAQLQHALPLDAFVMRQTQFNARRHWLNGLAGEVAATGVLLHAS